MQMIGALRLETEAESLPRTRDHLEIRSTSIAIKPGSLGPEPGICSGTFAAVTLGGSAAMLRGVAGKLGRGIPSSRGLVRKPVSATGRTHNTTKRD
jgi:hypothetical protein